MHALYIQPVQATQLSYQYNKHRRYCIVRQFLDSIVVSIPVSPTGDRGSIPCQGGGILFLSCYSQYNTYTQYCTQILTLTIANDFYDWD